VATAAGHHGTMSKAVAIAWYEPCGARYVGKASLDGNTLWVSGSRPGSGAQRHAVCVPGHRIDGAAVVRDGTLPAVQLSADPPLRVELLEGGYGAAHLLADAIGRMAGGQRPALGEAQSERGDEMSHTIAIAATIRPGCRGDLERKLAEGPPFDLAGAGFEEHQVYIGDQDVVFVFGGVEPFSAVNRLARQRSLFEQVLRMTALVSAPRLLNEAYAWKAEPEEHGAPV
jgi:hypothetical protein